MNQPELKDYKGIINKQSWAYAKKYLLDFEDVQSQAFVIFCEALQKYDDRRASFSTYLWHRLRMLEGWCWNEVCVQRFLDESIPEDLPMEKRPKLDLSELGLDAAELVRRIVRGDFYDPEHPTRKAGFRTKIAKVFPTLGWSSARFSKAWTEAKSWWRETPSRNSYNRDRRQS